MAFKLIHLGALALCCLVSHVMSEGAGRAFPVDSENYAIREFRKVNPRIRWDETNFLVDLSGLYANCGWIGKRDWVYIDKTTPDGQTIAGYTDDVPSDENHVDATHEAIELAIDSWMMAYNSDLFQQIEVAEKFGCSVRPGCQGSTSIGCLFSPQLIRGGVAQIGSGVEYVDVPHGGDDDEECEVWDHSGRAFTPQQYRVAESTLGVKWDRSNFLEDLSGFAVSCDMIGAPKWNFTIPVNEAARMGIGINPIFGSSPNMGETEPAMVKVLRDMPVDPRLTRGMGCSILPDCMKQEQMWVVVCCLFETSY